MKDYIFIDQDIDQLRKDILTTKKHYFNRLDEQCRLYEAVRHETTHPTCSTTYMGIAIANLSLAYVLTKQTRYLEEAKRWINAVVSYAHWGNAHLVDVDLSAAWILFGLSIGYDWLEDELDATERTAIKEKLILQGERMYDFKVKTEGSGWSTNYWQNHNWINLTGLACAGYALRSDYANAKTWTECAKENFDYVYKDTMYKIARTLLIMTALVQLAISQIHIEMITQLFVADIGFYMFIFILSGLLILFNLTSMKEANKDRLGMYIVMTTVTLASATIFVLKAYNDFLTQESVLIEDIRVSLIFIIASSLVYLIGGIIVVIKCIGSGSKVTKKYA